MCNGTVVYPGLQLFPASQSPVTSLAVPGVGVIPLNTECNAVNGSFSQFSGKQMLSSEISAKMENKRSKDMLSLYAHVTIVTAAILVRR